MDDIAEKEGPPLNVIEHAAGCADDQVDPLVQGPELPLDRLASMTLKERQQVPGLHPDRAPTIVAGAVILVEILRLFGLDQVEVSEHDILRGAALGLA